MIKIKYIFDRIKGKIMKKLIILLLLSLILINLLGCSNDYGEATHVDNINKASDVNHRKDSNSSKSTEDEKSYTLEEAQDKLIYAIKRKDKYYDLLSSDNYVFPAAGHYNTQIMKEANQSFPKIQDGDELVIFKDMNSVNLAQSIYEFYTYPLVFSPHTRYKDFEGNRYIEYERSSLSRIFALDKSAPFSPGSLEEIESINGISPIEFIDSQTLAYIASTTENLIVCEDSSQKMVVDKFNETKLEQATFESKYKVYSEDIIYIGNWRDEAYLNSQGANPYFEVPVEKTYDGYFIVNIDTLENGKYIIKDYTNSMTVDPITMMFEISR